MPDTSVLLLSLLNWDLLLPLLIKPQVSAVPPIQSVPDVDAFETGDNRIYDMIVDYPEEVALLLEDLGYTADELHEMLGIQDHGYINEYLERVS